VVMDYPSEIKRQLIEFDIDGIKVNVQNALDDGVAPLELVDALGDAMKDVGDKYESGEFFFSELIMAGETMKEAMEVLKPAMTADDVKSKGKVVIGTVKGDLHDIGKDLVVSLLVAAGVEVIDVGVDVPAEKFVEAVKNEGAKVVGLSALLSTTITYTKEVVEALKEAGVRDQVKIIVGGAAATDELAKEMGADACAADAVLGVRMVENWLTG
jgi:5-methyltetrahydrofolate--homocysteine methyltransferase